MGLALRCCREMPEKRPTMTEVVSELEQLGKCHVDTFSMDLSTPMEKVSRLSCRPLQNSTSGGVWSETVPHVSPRWEDCKSFQTMQMKRSFLDNAHLPILRLEVKLFKWCRRLLERLSRMDTIAQYIGEKGLVLLLFDWNNFRVYLLYPPWLSELWSVVSFDTEYFYYAATSY